MDLTSDTITPESVLAGFTGHGADGEPITGTASGGGLPSVIRAGDTPVLYSPCTTLYRTSSSAVDSGASITIPRSGQYRFKWSTDGETNGRAKSQIYVNGTAYGSVISGDGAKQVDINVNAGDVIKLYLSGGSYTYYVFISGLVACIDWNNGF